MTEILFTVVVVVVVWRCFDWIDLLRRQKNAAAKARLGPVEKQATRKPVWGSIEDPAEKAEELVQCQVCQVYVRMLGARSCGRAGCPFPD